MGPSDRLPSTGGYNCKALGGFPNLGDQERAQSEPWGFASHTMLTLLAWPALHFVEGCTVSAGPAGSGCLLVFWVLFS